MVTKRMVGTVGAVTMAVVPAEAEGIDFVPVTPARRLAVALEATGMTLMAAIVAPKAA
jgi:hypothetical protein